VQVWAVDKDFTKVKPGGLPALYEVQQADLSTTPTPRRKLHSLMEGAVEETPSPSIKRVRRTSTGSNSDDPSSSSTHKRVRETSTASMPGGSSSDGGGSSSSGGASSGGGSSSNGGSSSSSGGGSSTSSPGSSDDSQDEEVLAKRSKTPTHTHKLAGRAAGVADSAIDFSLGTVLQQVQRDLASGDMLLACAPHVRFGGDFPSRVPDSVSLVGNPSPDSGTPWVHLGGPLEYRVSIRDGLAHPSLSGRNAPLTVTFPLFTTGSTAPFPKLRALGERVDVSLRLLGIMYHHGSRQSLKSGDIVCVDMAAFNDPDKYFAVLGFARAMPESPPVFSNMQVILAKVHHEKCYVCPPLCLILRCPCDAGCWRCIYWGHSIPHDTRSDAQCQFVFKDMYGTSILAVQPERTQRFEIQRHHR
jgi:hypothetical protein